MAGALPNSIAPFAEIIQQNEPLAPFSLLRLGGAAEYLAQPVSKEQLVDLVNTCRKNQIPLRVLGSGCNLLIRDEGVAGVVVRLSQPAFTQVKVVQNHVHAGAGASLSSVISEAARHGLAGLETLLGIPGTIGGAMRHQAGDRVAEIVQFVRGIEMIDADGRLCQLHRNELSFDYGSGGIEEGVIVTVSLELESDSAENIVKRMRKAWIQRKANQPPSYQAAVRAFKNPRGLNAAEIIEQAGFAGAKVGGAQISDRDPSYLIAHPGATARDLLRLIDLVCSHVEERFNVRLELALTVW